MNYKLIVLSVVLQVLTACSVTPDKPEVDLVMSKSYFNLIELDSSYELTNGTWWVAFDDPTLNTLIDRAKNQNISLQIASKRVQSARSYHQIVSSLKVPTVSIGTGYSAMRLSENEAWMGPIVGASHMGQSLVDNQSGNFLLGADISWEMDLFGKVDAISQSAQIKVEQAELLREGLHISMTNDVISNYLQMRSAQSRQVLIQKSITVQKQAIALIENLEQSGMASGLELARAQSLLATTMSMLPQLSMAEDVHLQRLAMLLGEDNQSVRAFLGQAEQVPAFKGSVPIGIPSELLKRRPDLKAEFLEIEAVNYELGAAIASQYPSFHISASPGLIAEDFTKVLDSGSGAWLANVGVRWNVFDYGRSSSQVELTQSRLEASVLKYQQSVNSAISEVELLLRASNHNQQIHKKSQDAKAQGEFALERASALYEAGLIDQIELIDAQRQVIALDEQELAARTQSVHLIVSLQSALGGDLSLDVNELSNYDPKEKSLYEKQ